MKKTTKWNENRFSYKSSFNDQTIENDTFIKKITILYSVILISSSFVI